MINKDMKKLIIYTHGGGRFANQLIAYGHLIAFIIESDYQYDLINMSFSNYIDFFDPLPMNSLCTDPANIRQINFLNKIKSSIEILPQRYGSHATINFIRLLNICASVSPNRQSIFTQNYTQPVNLLGTRKEKLCLDIPDDVNLFERADVTILSGWNIRSWQLFEKHKLAIKDKLLFNNKYINKSRNFIDKLREKYSYLIGVFIRQGDYRRWENGRFFFETDQYIAWIKDIRERNSCLSNIGFVVASDEPQIIEQFHSLDVYFTTGIAGGEGHYLESLIELSFCDLIISPPSTFASWAAFMGEIPLLPLYASKQPIDISDKKHFCKNMTEIVDNRYMSCAVK
jgi:hypothetical protein